MEKTLSIIVPVYNEEKILSTSLPRIFDLAIRSEIIVVDDGSTDNSFEILKEMKKKYNFHLLSQTPNQGKGAAVVKGLEKASGDYFIVCDADLEYDTRDIQKIWEYAQSRQEEKLAIYGSRWLDYRPRNLHYLINRFLTETTNLLFGCRLSDMETCFKLVPMSALPKLNLSGKRFEIEPEITARLIKNGYHIIERPISYKRRGYGAGKKIKPSDGFKAIATLLRERFNRT